MGSPNLSASRLRLKPFQRVGCEFLIANARALLADEMRLGKTAQAVVAARRLGVKRTLVVCPAIARTHWRKDWEAWWPSGPTPIVVSYEGATAGKGDVRGQWDLLILDESHYLKNPHAKRTQAILGRDGIVRRAKRIWALSGTPAPNHVGELWPLLRVYGATPLNYDEFLCRYCHVDPFTGRVRGTKKAARQELKVMVQGIMLRRTKEQVAPELPKAMVSDYYVEADASMLDLACPVQTEYWERKIVSLEERLREELNGLTPAQMLEHLDNAVTEMSTLRRLHAVLKLPALVQLIRDEVGSGQIDKLVVFGYHRDGLVIPHGLLKKDFRCDILYGGTPAKKRDAILARFERPVKKHGTQVLFASIPAAGTAIDLSASHNGILLERDWVPANNAQALERMGGHKQTRPIHIRDLRIAGSIDDVIGKVLARKMRELSEIIG